MKRKLFIDEEKKLKECSKCNVVKAFNLFHMTDFDKPQYICKQCASRYSSERYYRKKARALITQQGELK